MEFYKLLSQYYDEIFPAATGDMAFLKTRLQCCLRVLDLGCGSGNKTILLAEPGRNIIGVDLDQDMIDLANNRHQAAGLEYRLGDISKLDSLFPDQSFDAVLCLGNTLVHLLTTEALGNFFNKAADLLPSGGRLIIQILNYDFLFSRRIRELPLIETDRLIFRRLYEAPASEGCLRQGQAGVPGDWTAEGICFRSILELKDTATDFSGQSSGHCHQSEANVYESSVRLRPIFKDGLSGFLSPNFKNTEYFGGFDGRPWAEDSFVTISISTRR